MLPWDRAWMDRSDRNASIRELPSSKLRQQPSAKLVRQQVFLKEALERDQTCIDIK